MKLSKFSKHVSRLTNEYSAVRVKKFITWYSLTVKTRKVKEAEKYVKMGYYSLVFNLNICQIFPSQHKTF